MKILLDVHFSPAIAEQLRTRGHDVTAAADDPGARRLADEELLTHAVDGGRALVTNNARDFVPLAADWVRSGRDHFGLFLMSDRSLPRRRADFGLLVGVLDELLNESESPDSYRNQVLWLHP